MCCPFRPGPRRTTQAGESPGVFAGPRMLDDAKVSRMLPGCCSLPSPGEVPRNADGSRMTRAQRASMYDDDDGDSIASGGHDVRRRGSGAGNDEAGALNTHIPVFMKNRWVGAVLRRGGSDGMGRRCGMGAAARDMGATMLDCWGQVRGQWPRRGLMGSSLCTSTLVKLGVPDTHLALMSTNVP